MAYLLNEWSENSRDHEDCENAVLQSRVGRVLLPEGEPNEESGHDAESELSKDVLWSAPVLLESTICDEP
jgi:hypothetical protein